MPPRTTGSAPFAVGLTIALVSAAKKQTVRIANAATTAVRVTLDDAGYTRQGPFATLRFKFDQDSPRDFARLLKR